MNMNNNRPFNVKVLLGGVLILGLIVYGIVYLYRSEDLEVTPPPARPLTDQQIADKVAQLPLSFVENKGQVDEVVEYLVKTGSTTIFFTLPDVVFSMIETPTSLKRGPRARMEAMDALAEDSETVTVKQLVLRQRFTDANREVVIRGEDELQGKVNHFIGNDPDKWIKEARTYAKVRYQDIYPGIDLTYQGGASGLSFEYTIQPGSDYEQIKIEVEGADNLVLSGDGTLVFESSFGNVGQVKPVAYQIIDGKRIEVFSQYVVGGEFYSFKVSGHDESLPLMISQQAE